MLDVKAGDEQSFELLLQRYRTPLVNFLYRMVRAREEAEVAEASESVVQNMMGFKGRR